MAIQGLRHTTNFAADERPLNWRAGLLLLEPNGSAPLFALTSLMSERKVDDPEFNWWEKSMQTRRVVLNSSYDNSDDPVTIDLVSGGNAFKVGDLLLAEESGEILRVNSVTNDTTVVLSRTWGSVAKTAVNPATAGTNPNLTVIGNAMEENSEAPGGVAFDPTKKFNYTQIFRHTMEMSRTAQHTRLRTTDQVKEAKRETLQIHSADIERALWFGNRIETTINGNPARSMGGIKEYIAAGNIVTSGSTTDLEDLEGWLEQAFRFGSSEKMGFTGNRGMLVVQQIVRKNSSYQIFTGEKEFGMNVTRLITPFGELVLKTHPLFNQMTSGSTGGLTYQATDRDLYILDMAELKYVIMESGETKWQPKLQTNGLDGVKSGYLTEAAMEFHHPTAHFLIQGLQAAATDN